MTAKYLMDQLKELAKTQDLSTVEIVIPGMYDLKNQWVSARFTDLVTTAKSGTCHIRCDFDGDKLDRIVWEHAGGNKKMLKIGG